jgi:predicted GNAT family acetyltransferase
MSEDIDEGYEIVQIEEEHRFVAIMDSGKKAGYLEYELSGQGLFNKVLIIPSTVVKPEFGGRGIASELASEAFSWARKIGAIVDPVCPFIASYIDKNPVYQDLLTEPEEEDTDI